MTDVGIGGGAPSAPSSAPSHGGGEAVIDPSPVNIPSPIGPQSAPAPVRDDFKGSEHRPESRRETIQRAFERARTDPVPTSRPKPGLGHNQPPEPTPKERPAEPKLDLKKRPVDEPPQREGRRRGEHGHFAARDATRTDGQQTQAGQRSGQPAPIHNPLPAHAPYREPLPRMDAQARADWPAAPESVRASVHRMHREFSNASQKMRGLFEAMAPITPYHRMAREHGTTLERALHNYTSMEAKLRADPIGGLDVIIANLNLRTPDGQRLGLRDIAWHVLNQTPEQHQLVQSQNAQGALAEQLAQVRQRQQALEYHQAQMHHAQQFAHMRGQVDRFAETHPRLDELGTLIEHELRLGFDLPTAYRRADLLHPAGHATHAAQTRTAPAQTRIDRSLTGAPDSSLNGGPRRQKPSATPREAAANAFRRYGLM
jgi:hypothetical protein